MNPLVVPASTITTALAGSLTVIIVWAIHAFSAVVVPPEVAGAMTVIASVLTSHFTTDAPTKVISEPKLDPSISVKQ